MTKCRVLGPRSVIMEGLLKIRDRDRQDTDVGTEGWSEMPHGRL